jgi:hypothetical protein
MTATPRDWSKAKRQRQRVFPIRLTDAEHAELVSRAERAGLSVAGLIRQRCLDLPPPRASRRPVPERVELVRLLGQIGKIGGNVHQITRAMNAGGSPSAMVMEDAARDVAEMRAAILAALGRASPDDRQGR